MSGCIKIRNISEFDEKIEHYRLAGLIISKGTECHNPIEQFR